MNFWRSFFPFANGCGSKGKVASFVIGLIINWIISFVVSFVGGLISLIPYIGWIIALGVYVIGLYLWANFAFTIVFFILAKVAQAKANKPIETTAEEV